MYCSLHSHSQLRTEQYLAFYTTRRDTLGSATAAINGNVKNALNKTTVFNELHCIKREPKNLMVFNSELWRLRQWQCHQQQPPSRAHTSLTSCCNRKPGTQGACYVCRHYSSCYDIDKSNVTLSRHKPQNASSRKSCTGETVQRKMAAQNVDNNGLKMAEKLVDSCADIQLGGDLTVPQIHVTNIDRENDSCETSVVLLAESAATPAKTFLSTVSLRLSASSENISSETAHNIVIKKTTSNLSAEKSKSDTDLRQTVHCSPGIAVFSTSDVTSEHSKTRSGNCTSMDTHVPADDASLSDTVHVGINSDVCAAAKELTPVGNACAEDESLELSSSVKWLQSAAAADGQHRFDATPVSHAVSDSNLCHVMSVHVDPGDDEYLSKSSDDLTMAHGLESTHLLPTWRGRQPDDVTSSEDVFVDCADEMLDLDVANSGQIPENPLETQGVIMEDFMRILEFNTSLSPMSKGDADAQQDIDDDPVTLARPRESTLSTQLAFIDAISEPIDENVDDDDYGGGNVTSSSKPPKSTSELVLPELDTPVSDSHITAITRYDDTVNEDVSTRKATVKSVAAKSKLKTSSPAAAEAGIKAKTKTVATKAALKSPSKTAVGKGKNKAKVTSLRAKDQTCDSNNNDNVGAGQVATVSKSFAVDKPAKTTASMPVGPKRFSLDDDFLLDPIKAKEKRESEQRSAETVNVGVTDAPDVAEENATDGIPNSGVAVVSPTTDAPISDRAAAASDDRTTAASDHRATAASDDRATTASDDRATAASDDRTTAASDDRATVASDDDDERDQDEFIKKVSAT